MGTQKITLGVEELNTVSLRLKERADSVHQFSLMELVADLRIAARACSMLAHMRFELGEIAGHCRDEDAAREIMDLLDDASVAEPTVGEP